MTPERAVFMLFRKYAPQSLKQSGWYRQLSRKRRIHHLRKLINNTEPLKVILGAGATEIPDWIGTDRDLLDVTSPNDWQMLFEPGSIDLLLSEHMLEHLSEQEGLIALHACFQYLKPGGLFRIAVPDGYRRDPTYVNEASPPNDGHQVLYNVDTLTTLLQSVGFTTTPLEYFDAQEQFHAVPWDEKDGLIRRSARFDTQQSFRRGDLFYTSLIVDARKQ